MIQSKKVNTGGGGDGGVGWGRDIFKLISVAGAILGQLECLC